jgi:integrase
VRVYYFDPNACADLAQLPPVGIHPGMPFVLDDEGRQVVDLNRWLRTLPTSGVPAPNSWSAYARDLLAWLRFLDQRGVDLLDSVASLRDAVAAYHADRRMGDLARRLAPSSWNRAVAAIARFYDWAQAHGLIDAVPFNYRSYLVRTDCSSPRLRRRNLATERDGRPSATIRWLETDYLELFLSTGLGGRLADGGADVSFRGREAARNAAVGRLAAGSGLRSQEFSHLLVWELPSPPLNDGEAVVAMAVPAAVTKGTKARTTWVPSGALAEVHAYVALERSAAVRGSAWRPAGGALQVADPDANGGHVNGRRVRWSSLGPAERRRLVAPGGGAAVLAVRADGGALTDWEHTFAAASRRCRRIDPRFPSVTPHMLRHSFAVHTLRLLVRTHLADAAKLTRISGGDPAWALALRAQDPLLVLRDLLGHASVSTTEVYLRMVDTTRLFTDVELGEAESA